jgi:hypothetical protein
VQLNQHQVAQAYLMVQLNQHQVAQAYLMVQLNQHQVAQAYLVVQLNQHQVAQAYLMVQLNQHQVAQAYLMVQLNQQQVAAIPYSVELNQHQHRQQVAEDLDFLEERHNQFRQLPSAALPYSVELNQRQHLQQAVVRAFLAVHLNQPQLQELNLQFLLEAHQNQHQQQAVAVQAFSAVHLNQLLQVVKDYSEQVHRLNPLQPAAQHLVNHHLRQVALPQLHSDKLNRQMCLQVAHQVFLVVLPQHKPQLLIVCSERHSQRPHLQNQLVTFSVKTRQMRLRQNPTFLEL